MERIESLLNTIKNGEPREKLSAVFELAKEGIFDKMNVLISALENKDWEVRGDAMYYLGRIGWLPALERIGKMIIEERMYDNKNNAIYSLQIMGFPEGVPHIIQQLTDDNFNIRDDARTALYRLFGDRIAHLIDRGEEQFEEDEAKRKEIYTQDAIDISVWWSNNEDRYQVGKSYFFGELINPKVIFDKILEEPDLSDAYLYQLEDLTGQKFEGSIKDILNQWSTWLSKNQDSFIDGEKYFNGNRVVYF
ncbi:hypothetical protein GWK08_01305 [Leptobacterium flavescens]|uniref:HEAT repeat domain-containing protein n=1 Tax=Leptobacterium flavescens TaxID=472055 RepID=A0A6P0UFQ1_9FLAO|nr:HEAT repeat domain-containing protein [Leptobacterium flavescens]NER12065.1 hypothetical protein [Leptobacterium flavescens]